MAEGRGFERGADITSAPPSARPPGSQGLADLDDRALSARMAIEPEAFAVLYRRHLQAVHTFAYRRTGSTSSAEEVTAATFERALRAAHDFRWTRGGVLAWLYRIAGNEIVDRRRAAASARSPRGLAAAAKTSPAVIGIPGDGASPDELDALRDALDHLSPRHQQVIALRYLAELTPAEAAAALGTSRSTLAVTLHRAVAALRRQMQTQTQPTAGGHHG